MHSPNATVARTPATSGSNMIDARPVDGLVPIHELRTETTVPVLNTRCDNVTGERTSACAPHDPGCQMTGVADRPATDDDHERTRRIDRSEAAGRRADRVTKLRNATRFVNKHAPPRGEHDIQRNGDADVAKIRGTRSP